MAFNLTVKYRLITFLIVLTAYSSCTKEEYVTIDSKPVVADLTQVPNPKLYDYNFFVVCGEDPSMAASYIYL